MLSSLELEALRTKRRALIIAELRPRMRRVCPNFSEEDFTALIEQMATVQLASEEEHVGVRWPTAPVVGRPMSASGRSRTEDARA